MSERDQSFYRREWRTKEASNRKETERQKFIVYADSSLSICKFTVPQLQEILGKKGKVSGATKYSDLLHLALQGKNGKPADGVLLDSTFENWHDYSGVYTRPKPMFSYKSVAMSLTERGYRGPIVGLFGWEREDIEPSWYTQQVRRILVREDLEVKPELVLKALGIG